MEKQKVTDVYREEIQWLLDNSENAGYIIDIEKGTIVYMNDAGKKVFGVGDNIVGKSPVEVGNMTWDATLHDLAENKYYTYQFYNKKVNIMFMVREKLVDWDGVPCVLRLLTDITSMDNIEETIAEKIRIENTLLNFINILTGSGNKDNGTIINNMLELIGAYYSADRAYIVEVSEEGRKYLYEWAQDKNGTQKSRMSEGFRANTGEPMDLYKKDKAILIYDMEEIKESSPKEYAYYKEWNTECIYAVPYMEMGVVKGFVCVDNPKIKIGNYALLKTMILFVEAKFYRYKLMLEREYKLYHDALTGLQNRNGMRLYAEELAKELKGGLGVAVANINGLRDMNRDFGHDYGDKAMIRFAEFLNREFGNSGLFRLEGDEFVIICKTPTYNEFSQKILTAEIESSKVLLRGASFGFVWTDNEEIDLNFLVHRANQKMIVSKRQYYERYQKSSRYYDEGMMKNLLEEIKQGNFLVYFQPKIDVCKEELAGMEALIRYQSDTRGIVPPGKFVPLLEKEGLICYVDYFVLEKSCEILARWKKEGKKLVPISVNFSRKTMQENNVVEKIYDIIKKYQIPQQYILVEITETEGSLDRAAFVDIGSRIVDKGIGIALDDFCSEYSCVSLLTTLPFKEVKFDKSMIDRISVDKNMKILCESMMETCNRFGYDIVAEGVETEEQLAVLRNMNCSAIQGYYYSRPISVPEFEAKYLA